MQLAPVTAAMTVADKALVWQDVLLVLNLVAFGFYLFYTRNIAVSAIKQTEALSRPVLVPIGYVEDHVPGEPYIGTRLGDPIRAQLHGALGFINVGNGPALCIRWSVWADDRERVSAIIPFVQPGTKANTGVLSTVSDEFDLVVEYSLVNRRRYQTITHVLQTVVTRIATTEVKPPHSLDPSEAPSDIANRIFPLFPQNDRK